jgi:hypothetical protein
MRAMSWCRVCNYEVAWRLTQCADETASFGSLQGHKKSRQFSLAALENKINMN